jgi:molybdate transport system substrate-binding protein
VLFAAMLAESMPAQSQGRLRVLADTPLRPALLEIGEAFRRGGSGQQVEFVFDSSPVILEKLAAGETADGLIVQPDHIADLMKSGTVVRGEHPVIGRVGLGLAIRGDAPPQSIATEGLLREVLLKADTLLFNTVVSGDQFAAVLEGMNLTDAVKSKVVRLRSGPAIYDRVIRGKGNDIAAGVIPIINETKGVRLIGALPAELQRYQVYVAAPMSAAPSPDAARSFVAFLTGPAAKASFSTHGVE